MRKAIAALAGWYTRTEIKQWALSRGIEPWLAEALAVAAGSLVTTAILRV